MPWAAAAATVVGAGLNFLGQENASSNQNTQSQAALDFAKQQAAQQQANWQAQQDMLKAQWDARQKMIAPYNNARLGMLAYYGLGGTSGSSPAPMPAGYAGAPATAPASTNVAALMGSAPGFKPYIGAGTMTGAPTASAAPAPMPAGYSVNPNVSPGSDIPMGMTLDQIMGRG
jgi:hypothetical protein